MYVRRAVALAVALLAMLATTRASAWQEAHQIGEEARLHVDPNGMAAVQLDLHWNVVRGPLKFVDLAHIDPAVTLDPRVTILAEDGRELTAQATRRDDGAVRVAFDEPRAMMRGHFTFRLHWDVDLVATKALRRDAATWRLAWATPAVADGLDSLRTRIDLPAAPDAPRPILSDSGLVDESVVATLQRERGRDVLELVRPHVARGDYVSWTVRVDPLALPSIVGPRLAPASSAEAPEEPDRVREASLGACLLGLGLGFGLLVAKKARAFGRACAARGVLAEGLVRVPPVLRAPLAGGALTAAAGLQLAEMPTTSAAFVALATLLATFRAPRSTTAPRGPGRWFALRPADAFAARSGAGHWLDTGSREGRLAALAVTTAVLSAASLAAHWDSSAPWLVVMDSAALAPLFVTGLVAQLPPDGSRARAWLARAFHKLHGSEVLRVAPWARVLPDGASIDELRLLVLPRSAIPGVIGLEVGLSWVPTPVGWAGLPEILARVLDGSAAAARLGKLAPDTRALLGRRPEERVVRLVPNVPTPSSTVALARAIADALTDRRASVPKDEWTAVDRRVAPTTPGARTPKDSGKGDKVTGLCAASMPSDAAA